MSAAHQLYGGPLVGLVVMMAPDAPVKYPEALRLLREADDGTTTHVHVYYLVRSHAADTNRPQRPTYHYSHTTVI